MSRFSALIAVIFGVAGAVQASSVTFLPDGVGSETIFGVSSFTASGADMGTVGTMTVSVNGGSPVTWVASTTGPCTALAACGMATGSIGNGTWTLSQNLDTGSVADPANPDTNAVHPWILTTTSTTTAITSVVLTGGLLNGGAGVIFDRNTNVETGGVASGGQTGTPNSAGGVTYSIIGFVGGSPFDGTADGRTLAVNVTYGLKVGQFDVLACVGSNFPGSTPCGDEWGQLTFSFTGTTAFVWDGTTGSNISWTFFQDTDLVAAPEPLTLGLAGIGLLALAAYRRRRSA